MMRAPLSFFALLITVSAMTPAEFDAQMSSFVKPLYESTNGFLKLNDPTPAKQRKCAWFAEGTVSLYCMDKQLGAGSKFEALLGKPAPGDIDLGHECGQNNDGTIPVIQQMDTALSGKLPAHYTSKVVVGMLKFKPDTDEHAIANLGTVAKPVALDVHQRNEPVRGKTKPAYFCLCDSCPSAPLATITLLKKLYTAHNVKNSDKKLELITHLISGRDAECGPCTAVKDLPAFKQIHRLEARIRKNLQRLDRALKVWLSRQCI